MCQCLYIKLNGDFGTTLSGLRVSFKMHSTDTVSLKQLMPTGYSQHQRDTAATTKCQKKLQGNKEPIGISGSGIHTKIGINVA